MHLLRNMPGRQVPPSLPQWDNVASICVFFFFLPDTSCMVAPHRTYLNPIDLGAQPHGAHGGDNANENISTKEKLIHGPSYRVTYFT